ncbi:tyrosine-type recombinase/integrase [Enterovibrio sp. ZSDZ42]|uniref:Tyrosine-type recombinase/integrase n=1 Tax=Enterovibrio gelatinilyticus TaxID=2899819 RepID=A0ABT5QYE5_9GAMM|nr:tyrosine-type recombinase/integrase [Enterovibrio sp. ZSDZ42]MDD1792551.1 tyrosine-type recombinase/integrase [Enterovibrio sp. ZSDZ42]
MSIRNLKDGSKKPWLCECYPSGRDGKRIRKRFVTKAEAAQFERYAMNAIDDKPWLGEKSDNRRLLDMVEIWHRAHGFSLAQGKYTYNRLSFIANSLGNPLATHFSVKMWSTFREQRIAGLIMNAKGKFAAVKTSTVNHDQSVLNAMIEELIRMGEWKAANPLNNVRPFRQHETEMAFLSEPQIDDVLTAAKALRNESVYHIILVCLSTGARFAEAEQLRGSQLSKYKITFSKTKGKKNRTVPISPALYNAIYQPTSGRLFKNCYNTMWRMIDSIIPDLPEGQATHVFRHTFASHFMMNGGNIVVLQRILGHTDIKHTMRYAHFAPDHLEDAITKNPISNRL